MTRRLLLLAALAALTAVPAWAQQGGARAGDPISGNWGADGVTYLELQYNMEGVVTGTVIWRHEGGYHERARVTKGTFDSETGALKLSGEAKNRDGTLVQYAIDGRLDNDTLAGTYQLGTDKGEFQFKRQ